MDFLHTSIHEHHRFHAASLIPAIFSYRRFSVSGIRFRLCEIQLRRFYNFYFFLVKEEVVNDNTKLFTCLKGLDFYVIPTIRKPQIVL